MYVLRLWAVIRESNPYRYLQQMSIVHMCNVNQHCLAIFLIISTCFGSSARRLPCQACSSYGMHNAAVPLKTTDHEGCRCNATPKYSDHLKSRYRGPQTSPKYNSRPETPSLKSDTKWIPMPASSKDTRSLHDAFEVLNSDAFPPAFLRFAVPDALSVRL